jgi:hypothetical protein
MGWVSDEDLLKLAEPMAKSGYGKYLNALMAAREYRLFGG